jgi:hypothetical protein
VQKCFYFLEPFFFFIGAPLALMVI